MGCCSDVQSEALRRALDEEWDNGDNPVTLEIGPHVSISAVSGKPYGTFPNQRQVMLRGVRVGYINTDPGKAVTLLFPWDDEPRDELVELILDRLESEGYDVSKPRGVTSPKSRGLRSFRGDNGQTVQQAEAEPPSAIIIP